MGLDIHGIRLLIRARRQGVQFGKVLTFGRLELAAVPGQVADLLQAAGLPHHEIRTLQPGPSGSIFAEPVFRALGATEVLSLDASDYQSATVVHDMNQPLPEKWRGQFDVLYDGGSIEHVFNFPVAIRNCMELVRVGGSLFMHTAANNCMGHGFYQFSPELFYRVFSAENGYAVEKMILHRSGPVGTWYEPSDPARIRSRVELINFMPTQLLLHVRRVTEAPILERFPQQSDYVTEWSGEGEKPGHTIGAVEGTGFWARTFPRVAAWGRALRTGWTFYSTQSFRNRRYYTKIRD